MPRTLRHGWIETYTATVEKLTDSPANYTRWVAATVVGAALKRHVWIGRGSWKLYPNLFTFLIGQPAIGKGAAIEPGVSLIEKAKTSNILSDRLTMEWVKETLSKGFAAPPRTGPGGIVYSQDASCLLVAPELGVFLRHPEEELPDLAELWQCKTNMYATRGKGFLQITNPCPSFLAGCSPGWLKDSIPSNAAIGGFTRRVNFIFSNEQKFDNVWPDTIDWLTLPPALLLTSELVEISKLRGEYKFDNDAKPIFERIYKDAKTSTDFSDEATTFYTASRWVHAAKLAMCIAASNKEDLVITKDEMQAADDYTADVKNDLKQVFRSVGSSDMMGAADKVLKFIESSGSCTINQLMGAVWRDCSRPELDVILVTLRDAGLVDETTLQNRTVLRCKGTAGVGGGKSKVQRYGIY